MKRSLQLLFAILSALVICCMAGENGELRVSVGKFTQWMAKLGLDSGVMPDGTKIMTEKDLRNLAHKSLWDGFELVNIEEREYSPVAYAGKHILMGFEKQAEESALHAISARRAEIIPIDDLRKIGADAARKRFESEFDQFVESDYGKNYWYKKIGKSGNPIYNIQPRQVRDAYENQFSRAERLNGAVMATNWRPKNPKSPDQAN